MFKRKKKQQKHKLRRCIIDLKRTQTQNIITKLFGAHYLPPSPFTHIYTQTNSIETFVVVNQIDLKN